MLKSSNLTQNAEDFLKTSKPTSIIDKITNSINSTNELYLQLKNNTIETKTYIANFITKQKKTFNKSKQIYLHLENLLIQPFMKKLLEV